jgi:dolichol-phosphate mannosyltransferase
MSIYVLMINSDKKWMSAHDQVPKSCTVSIILSTENNVAPAYLHPQAVRALIPEEISSEIIIVHYHHCNGAGSDIELDAAPQLNSNKKTDINQISSEKDQDEAVHASVKGKFTDAIMRGVELSTGQFILVIDTDIPYPEELIPKIINELINSPDSVIIASKYAKGGSVQRLPFMRGMISKGARIIVRHGLKVKNVQDPLSGCFAISRSLLENIKIEGEGDQLLLEILVKSNRNKDDSKIPVKEVPFGQDGEYGTKKLDFSRIISYSKAIWHLYRYGSKSERLENDSNYVEQKKHKSVHFLSKAGRFFTVGASGLAINYLVSFLLANVVSNIWYLQATFIGIIISITTNFLLNKVWTFEDRDFSIRHFFRQYLSFSGFCALGAVIQLSLVYVFVEYSNIQYGISLVMAVCVASLGNFLLNKKLTFGEKIWG